MFKPSSTGVSCQYALLLLTAAGCGGKSGNPTALYFGRVIRVCPRLSEVASEGHAHPLGCRDVTQMSLLVATLVAACKRGTGRSQQKCFAPCKYCLEGGDTARPMNGCCIYLTLSRGCFLIQLYFLAPVHSWVLLSHPPAGTLRQKRTASRSCSARYLRMTMT